MRAQKGGGLCECRAAARRATRLKGSTRARKAALRPKTREVQTSERNGRAGSQIASHVLASIGSGHFSSAASSASGCRTFGLPPQWATIEAKTGARSPYAGSSGPALPPTYSVGWNTMCGNSSAKNEQCCPVPEATSRQVFIGPLPCEVAEANGVYCRSTLAMGSLLRSAEGAMRIRAQGDRAAAASTARWTMEGGGRRGMVALLFSGSGASSLATDYTVFMLTLGPFTAIL